MSQLPLLDNNVLTRIIRDLEQAQGWFRDGATVDDVLQASIVVEPQLVSLPSTSMAGPASPANAKGATRALERLPAEQNAMPTVNLTSDLAASTTLLQNLRTRNSIIVADLARATQSLIRCDEKATRLLLGERSSKAKWRAAALCLIATWVTYLWWCWYMRVEFAYIRKRRGEVFGV